MLVTQEDGSIIAGQSEISHPSPAPPPRDQDDSGGPPSQRSVTPNTLYAPVPVSPGFPVGGVYISRSTTPALHEARTLGDEDDDDDPTSDEDDAAESRNRNVVFSKGPTEVPPLPSRIKRIFYLNAYGTEIYPRANPQFIDSLMSATT